MQVFFDHREQLAPGVWQHYFRPERPLRFEPGQYVEFRLPGIMGDPRGAARVFTLTSLPDDEFVSFITKDQPQVSPYKAALLSLQPGSAVVTTDPMGDLILPKLSSIPLVFIAGGIGIASYVSMLRRLQNIGEHRDIQLYYGLRTAQELLFSELLGTFPFTTKTIAVAPIRLDVGVMTHTTPTDALWYISGSQAFVESMCAGLFTHGIDRQQTVFDYFDGYSSELA